jgi:hypothetical protein
LNDEAALSTMSDTERSEVDGKIALVCSTLDALGLMHALILRMPAPVL